MRNLTMFLIAVAIAFSVFVLFRSVIAAHDRTERDAETLPLGPRTFAPGGVPAVHDEELY